MATNRRNFLKAMFVGGVLIQIPPSEEIPTFNHYGYFRKGSESYREIKKLADLVIQGVSFSYSIPHSTKSPSPIQLKERINLSVLPRNKKEFSHESILTFSTPIESFDYQTEYFPSFAHLKNGIQTVLPQKIKNILNELEKIIRGDEVESINYYGDLVLDTAPIRAPKYKKEHIKQELLRQMLPTYQNFWRSIQPNKNTSLFK
ncbi:MAG: hypothetical protein KKG60_02080 [Nanoarchaeota archaeon]|nr:hypothetical protein [Nanoarchaeota archaeon]